MGENAAEIYEKYRGLIVNEANRFKYNGVDFEELMQIAYFGVDAAVKMFDPSLKLPFSGLLRMCVRRALTREVSKLSLVKISSKSNFRVRQYHAVKTKLFKKLDRTPSPREIADEMGLTAGELAKIEAYDIKTDVSYEALAESGYSGFIKNGDDGYNNVENDDFSAFFWNTVKKCLSEKEFKIITLHYRRAKSYKQIAAIMGIWPTAVKRSADMAISKLKNNKKIRDCWDLYKDTGG